MSFGDWRHSCFRWGWVGAASAGTSYAILELPWSPYSCRARLLQEFDAIREDGPAEVLAPGVLQSLHGFNNEGTTPIESVVFFATLDTGRPVVLRLAGLSVGACYDLEPMPLHEDYSECRFLNTLDENWEIDPHAASLLKGHLTNMDW